MDQDIIVTAIVSTYNSERFIQGCLEDLSAQTLADRLEIIVIDSGSQQNEGAVVKQFQAQNKNIVYLRTQERESLYKAWNRAIAMAKGRYLTNANTDDRHHPSSFERLAGILDGKPEFALAYHDQFTSPIENETFESCRVRKARCQTFPAFSHGILLMGCMVGSQPMWRRSVHEEYGFFDERYRIGADFEFWMRIAQTHSFVHVGEVLGVFYDSPHTMSGASNRFSVDKESLAIQLHYVNREPWRQDLKNRLNLAQSIFKVGYHYVEVKQDLVKAKVFLWSAWKLDPFNTSLAKTFIYRGLFKSKRGLGTSTSR